MKKTGLFIALLMVVGMAAPVFGVDVAFHGDMNNRFMIYTNHFDWFQAEQNGQLGDGSAEDNFGEIKYRFWTEIASDDDNIKGVYAVEIGGLSFGKPSTPLKLNSDGTVEKDPKKGGTYSGDDINIETRWAYTDFQIPGVDSKARFRIGLQPFTVNPYLWSETAMGVVFNGGMSMFEYQLAWMRTWEFEIRSSDSDADDVDNFLARFNIKPNDNLKAGIFLLWQGGDADSEDMGAITPEGYLFKSFANSVDSNIWVLGLDGGWSMPMGDGKLSIDWDLMYETGDIDHASFQYAKLDDLSASGNFDLSAYFFHTDVGYKWGDFGLTYTFWYASGDDDPSDNDFDCFLGTDLDRTDSWTIMEGNFADDDIFSERNYLLDKGFMMNKIAFDFQATDKLKLGAAGLYMMTAEDVEHIDIQGRRHSSDKIGFEVNGYATYMLYKNLELSVGAAYLFADDALDYFEEDSIRDGSSDENIFVSSGRIRYKF